MWLVRPRLIDVLPGWWNHISKPLLKQFLLLSVETFVAFNSIRTVYTAPRVKMFGVSESILVLLAN